MGIHSNFCLSNESLVLHGDTDMKGIDDLLQIPGPLKKFDFRGFIKIDERIDELPSIFYNFLSKHSPNLEEISLHITWTGMERNLDWKFPIFPALKSLKIQNCRIFKNSLFETSPDDFTPIEYDVCFPILETLSVSSPERLSLDTFIPGPGQVLKTVREVNFVYYSAVQFEENFEETVDQARIYMQLLDMFPNAKKSILKHLKNLLLP